MIDYLTIMKINGEKLYSKVINLENFEEEILIGFFASVSNFSQEALKMFVDEISLGEYKKIILLSSTIENLIIAAIVDKEDSKNAVQRILNEILIKFIGLYSPDYDSELIKVHEVEEITQNVFKESIRKYGFVQKLKSWIIVGFLGVIVRIISFLIGIYTLGVFQITPGSIDPGSFATLGTLNVLLLYTFPVYLNGYMCGNRKSAIRNGLFYLLTIQISYYGDNILGSILFGYLPVSFIITMIFALIGVYRAQQKYIIKK